MFFDSRAYARSTGRVSKRRGRRFDYISITLFVFAAFAVDSARAGVNTFTQIGPEGGLITDVAYHPTNSSIVYATTGAGFYRSTDGGESWTLVSDAFLNGPRAIAIHENAPSRVYVAAPGDGVFVSEDDGASIAQLSPFPVPGVNVSQASFSADGSVLYISADDRVYRSIDLGSTWTAGGALPIAPGEHMFITRLVVDPTNAAVIYVATGGTSAAMAYRSEDHGQNWETIVLPVVESPGNFNVDDLAVVPQTNRLWIAGFGGVWFKDLNGSAWTDTSFPDGGSTRVWIDLRDPSRVYGAGFDGLFVLPAVGQPWVNLHNDAKTARPTTLVAHPDDPNHLLLGGPEGLARSVNGGTIWTSSHGGIHAVEVSNLEPVPTSGRIYLSSVSNGVHWIDTENLTTTAANNEQLRVHGLFGTTAIRASPVHAIPSEPNRLVTALGLNLARSSDAGQSWQLLHTNLFPFVRSITSTSVEGVERILVLEQDGLFDSINGGDTWQEVDLPTDVDRIGELIAVAPSNRAVVLVTAYTDPFEPLVLKSEDGGFTWRRLYGLTASGIHSIAIDAHDDRTIFLMADNHLWKSTDGGESWSDIGVPATSSLILDPQNAQIMYGGYAPYIRRSVDGGLTWQRMEVEGLSLGYSTPVLAIDPARSHRLFVAHGSHGVKVISIEPDLALAFSQADEQITSGAATSFTYTVSNEGPFDATEVVATIELDDSATNISATATDGSCTQADVSITCTMQILRTDESKSIVVTTTPPETGTFALSASVRGAQPDPVSDNNSTESSIDVLQASDPSSPPSDGGATPGPPPSGGGGSSTPPPSSSGGGGGGGGGSSLLLIAVVALLGAARRGFVIA